MRDLIQLRVWPVFPIAGVGAWMARRALEWLAKRRNAVNPAGRGQARCPAGSI